MTAIAMIAATALLVAVASLALVQAVRGAEQATASSEAGKPMAVLAAGRREREVLLRVLAAAVFVGVAAALWYSSPVAEAVATWSEAALPAWLDWLV